MEEDNEFKPFYCQVKSNMEIMAAELPAFILFL